MAIYSGDNTIKNHSIPRLTSVIRKIIILLDSDMGVIQMTNVEDLSIDEILENVKDRKKLTGQLWWLEQYEITNEDLKDYQGTAQ
jgi:hypothetical protein